MNRFFIFTEAINEINADNTRKGELTIFSRKNLKKNFKNNKTINFFYCNAKVNHFLYLYYYLLLNAIFDNITIYYVSKLSNLTNIESDFKKLNKNEESFVNNEHFKRITVKSIKFINFNLLDYSKMNTNELWEVIEKKFNYFNIDIINNYYLFFKKIKKYSKNLLLVGSNNSNINLSSKIDNYNVVRFNVNIPSPYNQDKNRGLKTDIIFMGNPVLNYFYGKGDKKLEKNIRKEQLEEVKKKIDNGVLTIYRNNFKLFPFFLKGNRFLINNFGMNPGILDNIVITIAVNRWNMSNEYIYNYNRNKRHLTSGLFLIFLLLAFGIKPNICFFCKKDDKFYNCNYNKFVNDKVKKNFDKVKRLSHHDVIFERKILDDLIKNDFVSKID